MKPVSFLVPSLCLSLFASELILALAQAPPMTAGPASFERVGRSLEDGQLGEAAGELERLAATGSSALPKVGPAEEEILRRAIETSRSRLNEPANGKSAQDELAARKVLCLARAYFDEELIVEDGSPEPMKVEGDVARPELVGGPRPEYTPEAKQARVAGTVIMTAIIDREGCVRRTRILKGLPFGLTEAAAFAVRNWTFKPATLQNRPVAVDYVLTVRFQPTEDQEPAGRQGA